jgi:mono/diheme cytochrome c family protein
MSRIWLLSLSVLAVVGVCATAHGQSPVARGKYLVDTILTCQNCHTPKGERGSPIFERDLSGGLSWDEPPFKVTAPNITQDKATGIGHWTEAQIRALLRKGVRPSGVPVAPIMPTGFYEIMTDADLNAVVAYLKTVKPVSNKVDDPVYKLPFTRQIAPGGDKPFTAADLKDKVKRGFYLVTIGHCLECHTPMVKGQRDFSKIGTGGFEIKGPWGVSVSRNITSHKVNGIGAWSDAEVKRAITQGLRKDGSRLKAPMGYAFYAKMTGGDLNDIVAYLRTLPAKE